MENQRLLLYVTLFFVTYLLWVEWQKDYGPQPVDQVASPTAQPQDAVPVEEGTVPEAAGVPEAEQGVMQRLQEPSAKDVSGSERVRVVTDVLDVVISTRGGDIRRAVLRNYAKEHGSEARVVLLTDEAQGYHVAQSGLVSVERERAPTHNALYTAEREEYRLAEGEDTMLVPLTWQAEDGTRVTKEFIFHRGEYVIDVSHVVNAAADWSGSQYLQLVRTPPVSDDGNAFIYTYTGGVIYNEEIKYEKVDFDDMAEENIKLDLKDGWLAMIQHYFLAAWIPDTGNNNLYYSRNPANTTKYILGTRTPALKVAAGEEATFNSRFVAGPKLQKKLETIAPGLELVVDYGVLTIIAKPLFWLLDVFHDWFGNWGWAIIFLTISVKAVFYKLSEMSYRSMARMRKVAPRIQAMKEQYGDDRQGMSKAMMDLYKREKINPMGGCFPILVQMPVFIALYWVLLESVEMRHAPFILWIDNLSAMDPYFILPVIMGVSMWVQQKLNPAPVDPVQQKIFQYMPFVFTVMFAFFPSGLVLYWVVNNILSIAQQWVITRSIEKSA